MRTQPLSQIDALENQPPKATFEPTPKGNNTYYDMYIRGERAKWKKGIISKPNPSVNEYKNTMYWLDSFKGAK